MARLNENSKFRRMLTWLLLFSVVLSSFISSTTEPVYAVTNSNSRRATGISLAAGAGFGDISDFDSIDEKSLQTIAIYLSNFYVPFTTILDGDYTNEGAEDSGNKQHVESMKSALIRNCGFKKEVAEYLVGYVLEQSLASCKPVYMKVSDLEKCFKWATNAYPHDEQTVSYLGFSNSGYFSGARDKYATEAASDSHWTSSSIYYIGKKVDKVKDDKTTQEVQWQYINSVDKINIGGTEYIPISYAIFLGVMANVHLYWPSETSCRVDTLGSYNFYTMVTGSSGVEMKPVFDNSRDCLSMLLQALQYCDIGNGFSNGFASISSTDVKDLANPDITQYAIVSCPNVYVNWEGSLVFDNGVYRTIIVPGCMNPYMIQSWDGSSYKKNISLVNNISLSSIGLGLATDGCPTTMRSTYYYNWRVMMGASEANFDQGFWPWSGWGDNQSIADLIQSIDYINLVGQAGADYATFPGLSSSLPWDEVYSTDDGKFYKAKHSMDNIAKELVFYNNLVPVDASTTLDGLFTKVSVFDSSFLDSLKKANMDTYAQFKNLKKQGHSLEYPQSTKDLFQQIYLTYCFAAFNADAAYASSYSDSTNIVPIRLGFDNFPSANIDFDWSSIQQDQLGNEIMSFVYYLLHPTEGVAYVTRLFKNKMSGILLGWHEDIVGGTSSNAATGMTKYLGTSSYTTMPGLKDVSWVSGILNIYNNIVVYLIILMCLILLCYVLTGAMTIQRGIVGVVLFGICAFLPPIAINAAVDVINTTSDTIFSKKFDFWAICQMQNFVDQYEDAMKAQGSGDFGSYAAFVITHQSSDIGTIDSDDESSVSFSGTKVKWMAPKKYNSLSSLVQAVNEGTAMGNSSANFLKNSLLNMVAKSTSGETYLSDTDSLYLYRDYSDIFKYAHTSYNILNTFNYKSNLGCTNLSSTNWELDEAPLAMFIDTGASTYTKAWKGLGSSQMWDFVSSNVSNTLTSSTLDETSSIAHVSKGYLVDTIDYESNHSPGTSYRYMSARIGDNCASRHTLAVSYLANYTKTFREVHSGLERLRSVASGGNAVDVAKPTSQYYNFGLPKASLASTTTQGSYLWGYQEIIGLKDLDLPTDMVKVKTVYKNLSDVFYGLYSESPFFYFNMNIRDQVNAVNLINVADQYDYDFDNLTRGKQEDSDGSMNHVAKMFLQNNQAYFFNLTDYAGDGYGELRDFTNMHDFFYFVIPYLREGVELARLYDEVFGLYTDDDCSLIVNADGSCHYDGAKFDDLGVLETQLSNGSYTNEQLYKLWHTYNTYTILSAYTPWLDAMMDCNYCKPETITVLGEKFRVSDPLNPRTYYAEDPNTHQLTAGRYMVFSRSEMNAMGLTTADLTTVERKIIQFQDSVYNNTLNLMNYYTFSDEVMLQAYAMLQTFEFNKIFSQTTPVGEDFILYPQGYELKAFSYDAYLRMVVSGASGESLMFNGKGQAGNVSIYERVMKNTSLFFGLFLLLNDILAVYVIPGLKIFFLVTIFFCSILILIGSVIKMEMNIISVLWKSLIAPLLSFSAICIGMSLIVSMFMKTGANGVVSSEFIINVGDPTSAIILMIVLNVLVVILMFKIVKKCFRDFITYAKAVFDNIGSTFIGAVGAVAGGFTAGRAMDKFKSGGGVEGGSGVSRTAKQRGRDNDPRSGRSGVGSALAAGVGGAALGAAGAAAAGSAGSDMAAGERYDALTARERQQMHDRKSRSEDTVGMNKYDRKAYEGASAKQDAARDKLERDKMLASNSTGLRKARFEMAQKLHQRQLDSATIKQDNIKKYGTGLKSKVEGAKTVVGSGRRTRLEGIRADNDKRIAAREQTAQAAMRKRDAEMAKPMADAMTRQTKEIKRAQGRAAGAVIASQRGASEKKGSSQVKSGRNVVNVDFRKKRVANQNRAVRSSQPK